MAGLLPVSTVIPRCVFLKKEYYNLFMAPAWECTGIIECKNQLYLFVFLRQEQAFSVLSPGQAGKLTFSLGEAPFRPYSQRAKNGLLGAYF